MGIIALNLTVQTVKDVSLFPTAEAQNDIQRVAICDVGTGNCAQISTNGFRYGVQVSELR